MNYILIFGILFQTSMLIFKLDKKQYYILYISLLYIKKKFEFKYNKLYYVYKH